MIGMFWTGGVANKHLMIGPKGSSEFCFPEILNTQHVREETKT